MTTIVKLFRVGVLALLFTACNQEFNSVGVDLIATDQFDTEVREFPIFVSVNNLEDVQADQLGCYTLGPIISPSLG